MKKFLIFLLLATSATAFSQDWPVKKLVTDKKATGVAFKSVPAFTFSASKELAGKGTYQSLQLDAAFTRQIMAQRPEALLLSIPLSATETLSCELVKASLGNIKFTENNGQVIPKVRIPVLYRGVVSGENQKNNVILTVTDDYLSLVATFPDRAIQITQADKTTPLTYRLYNSTAIQFPTVNLNCGNIATGNNSKSASGIELNGTENRTTDLQDKCVNVFVECFDSLYRWQDSSRQKTIYYVYELFNLVTTGFLNDSVNIQVMGINVWTTPDPYRGDSRDNALKDLANYYKDNFWGNICIGLDYGSPPRFGLASGFGKVKANTPNSCPIFNSGDSSGAFAYSDQNYGGSYQNFPVGPGTTQGEVYQVMHEIGHLLGSRHTHWCGWLLSANPNVFGAIDNCALVEGMCSPGPPPPASGGTIMSYCNSAPGFVNFNNGFGPIPGRTIRNFVRNSSCIPSCLACLINKVEDKKKDGISSSQALLLPGTKKQQTPLRFSPHNQNAAFLAPRTFTAASGISALPFRKPGGPAPPFAGGAAAK